MGLFMKQSELSKAEYRKASELMLSLIEAFLGEKDDYPVVCESDLRPLYMTARLHALRALTAAALRKGGIRCEAFDIALAKAQRRSLLFEKEWKMISRQLEQNGIRLIPLKGMVLKSLYPGIGLREMSDMDILFDKAYADTVRQIMKANGYKVFLYDRSNHDVYRKKPFYNIEMHRSLFDETVFGELSQYFDGKVALLFGVQGKSPSMSIDMTYLYLISHAYVHYSLAGIGLRVLLDLYLFLKEYETKLDFSFISDELTKLDLGPFEEKLRGAALNLFTPELRADVLDEFVFSGLYGNDRLYYEKRILRKTHGSKHWRSTYFFERLRPSRKDIRGSYFFSKHPSLSGLMVITKPVKALFTNPKKVFREIKEVSRYKYSDK